MSKVLFSKYRQFDLGELIEKLDNDYYQVTEEMCNNAHSHAMQLLQKSNHESTYLYITLCNELTGKIKEYVKLRRSVVKPYVVELHQKDAEGHNCTNCSGKCYSEHSMQMKILVDSHIRIREVLEQLRNGKLREMPDTIYPLAYRVFSNEITLLESILTELYYLEEVNLIPRVSDAQKKINAYS